MPDLGPDPDRSVSGSFAPGEDTGLVHVSAVPSSGGLDRLHWPSRIPSALLITARLGSLAAGASTTVWMTEATTSGDVHAFWFAASRSADGNTVRLHFGHRDNSQSLQSGNNASAPWEGGDHLYAWAGRFTSLHPNPFGTIYASGRCEAAGQGFDGSGANEFIVERTAGISGEVPASAPSDLRVEHVASWWKPEDTTTPPSADQLQNRLLVFTCQRWFVGFVGSRG